jgi:diguanylate cyclase (GGDEF)-like protein
MSLLISPLLRGLPEEVASRVLADATIRQLETGERLIARQTANDILYIIIRGSLDVRIARPDRADVRLGPGDCAGELSVLDGSPASADLVAAEPTVVAGITRDQLWSIIDETPTVARNLLAILAGRVRHDNTKFIESDRVQAELERAAMIDATTGLRNRRWLDHAFARHIARAAASGQPLGLLMIDLDGFKQVNDQQGHLAGDALLRRIGQWLTEAVRPGDLLARFGGDEFAVLLPDCTRDLALQVADRIRGTVSVRRQDLPREWPPVSLSIGATAHERPTSLEAMVAEADAALYDAKRAGRDRVHRFRPPT